MVDTMPQNPWWSSAHHSGRLAFIGFLALFAAKFKHLSHIRRHDGLIAAE